MSNVYIKTRIRSGRYAIEYLQNIRNKRILVVCDRFLSESRAINYITDALDPGNSVEIFDQAVPDPTTSVVGKGLGMICRVRPEIVIGFGGGSAIDTAKGIIYFAGLRELVPKPEFITIPTTSGTGSEVTSAAVITDPENKSKHLISSDDILADVAILDPRLTLSVPPSITANTGMDVFTHALEAYVSTGSNVFSDALSEKAVELLLKALLSCYGDGKNLESRTLMHEASTLAGMAFNTAGLGVNHSIAHQLGGTFHIPHGLANALLLNRVIEYNSVNHDVMRKYAALAYKVQLAGMDEAPEFAVNALKELITTLMHCMNMPSSIRELDIDRDEYEQQLQNMIDNALMDNCLSSTPREIGTASIREILLSIY
ncbi:1-propanol dehydrogenase PduQ [Clostridium sp. Marseille-P2415]|uniref:1-propanol dehydrogenase PduQ n=1 Tax=Clostridium sp. Marseille-P2415 TaxID=1805471 RepID=UPI0009883065|nr:1-propanol dehydrogenase PduQ [Clostridium sp. Marseille-P2415]